MLSVTRAGSSAAAVRRAVDRDAAARARPEGERPTELPAAAAAPSPTSEGGRDTYIMEIVGDEALRVEA